MFFHESLRGLLGFLLGWLVIACHRTISSIVYRTKLYTGPRFFNQINLCKSEINGIYLGLSSLLSHIIYLDLQFGIGIFRIYAPILNCEINSPKSNLVGLDLRLSSHSPLIITCTNQTLRLVNSRVYYMINVEM